MGDRLYEFTGQLDRIEGWLLVYVVTAFFGGLAGIGQTADPAHPYVHWVNVTGSGVGVLSGIAVLMRWTLAVRLVGVALWLRLASLFCVGFAAMRVHRLAHPAGTWTQLVIATAVAVAWLLYFRVSRRVRDTLGRNL